MVLFSLCPLEESLLARSLPDARPLSDEILEALRLRAMHGHELGFSETDMVDLLGVSRETVCRWWSASAQGGRDALPQERSGRPLGSGRLLTDAQAAHIQELLRTQGPEEVGIAAPLWSRRAVQDLIRPECAVTLAVRTVGLYLRRWGFTPKRPSRHSRDQEPEEVRHWLEETYPTIAARAAREGAEIWCDEVGVAADEHPARGYAPQGEQATIDVPDRHIRANQISTITNAGRVRFMTYLGTMNAALLRVFLERLLRSTTGKVFLIIDRLRAHQTPEVVAWLARHRDRLVRHANASRTAVAELPGACGQLLLLDDGQCEFGQLSSGAEAFPGTLSAGHHARTRKPGRSRQFRCGRHYLRLGWRPGVVAGACRFLPPGFPRGTLDALCQSAAGDVNTSRDWARRASEEVPALGTSGSSATRFHY
jgi:transposase